MIGYLKGNLVWSDYLNVIINVNGLGYEVNYKNNFSSSDLGKPIEIFSSHKVSEYGETLYGFTTVGEKILFDELSGIKGIGARTVYSILSELDIKNYAGLKSVTIEDLTGVSRVGKSTAKKFLLAISDKVKKEFDVLSDDGEKKSIKDEFSDIISVLTEWGMAKKDLESFISKHYTELKGKGREDVIKYVFTNMK
jgi:Holliday junction DNA helicase RuvA